jgi:DNA polymerase (family 10)
MATMRIRAPVTARRAGRSGARSASRRATRSTSAASDGAVSRRIENAEVARVLREIADLLDVEGANAFRVRAYRGAARTVEELTEPIATLARGDGESLSTLPGIGEDLAGKICEIVRTGTHPLLRQLERATPAGAAELMHVRGIGPRRARILCERLRVHSLAALEKAARAGRIRDLPGFGATTERAILRELEAHRTEEHRVLRATAVQYGEELVRYLREGTRASRIELAGSLRRCRETVGDLDVLAAARDPQDVVERFTTYPSVADVLERGATKASVRLRSGLQVDLRVVEPRSFGAALYYFTGSKAHNIAVRRLGLEGGLTINEYGVHRGKRWIAGREERDVFAAVKLPWIPPELREDRGEIEAAATGRLPRLITLEDLRGDLQSHTTDTDGRDSLEAMAETAQELGHEYLAITDHTPAVRVTGGLDAAGFRRQWKRIDRLNARLERLTLLKGVEVDIHADGSLDLRGDVLAEFDIVLASIHSDFELSRDAQTKRLLRAIAHPAVDVIAHPTSRLIGRRQGVAIDLDQIARAAADHGVALELNAQPERLDLDDLAARRAVEAGARLSIGSDAHSTAELRFLRWGIDQARRAWVEGNDVINTRSLVQLQRLLHRGRH